MPRRLSHMQEGPLLVKAVFTEEPYKNTMAVTSLSTKLVAVQVVEHKFDGWKNGFVFQSLLTRKDQVFEAIFVTEDQRVPPLMFTVKAMGWSKEGTPVDASAFDNPGKERVQVITIIQLAPTSVSSQQVKEQKAKSRESSSGEPKLPTAASSAPTGPILAEALPYAYRYADLGDDNVSVSISGTGVHRGARRHSRAPYEEGEEEDEREREREQERRVDRMAQDDRPRPPQRTRRPPPPPFNPITNQNDLSREAERSHELLHATIKGINDTKRPVGLFNVGNSCFMNAVLQCLFFSRGLRLYFTNTSPRQKLMLVFYDVKYRADRKQQAIMAANFAALMFMMSERVYQALTPLRFRQAVSAATDIFEEGVEHDAQEFLAWLIDALHEDVDKGDKRVRIPEQNNINLRSSEEVTRAADNAWNAYKMNSWSMIYDLFTGQTISTMKCAHCSLESNTFDMCTQITAEIPEKAANLNDCMCSQFLKETLPDWNCPNCKVKRMASKEFKLWRLPAYMIIQLKRFKPTPDGTLEKNDSAISCPMILTDLFMQNHMHPHSTHHTGFQYQLYAIVHHTGSLTSGHYTATAREGKEWYHFDDENVRDGAQYLTRTATGYLLFYERETNK